jgi:hypothetical protein
VGWEQKEQKGTKVWQILSFWKDLRSSDRWCAKSGGARTGGRPAQPLLCELRYDNDLFDGKRKDPV